MNGTGRCQADDTARWVVELDLSKVIDRVNYDILMNRIARVTEDKQILELIR